MHCWKIYFRFNIMVWWVMGHATSGSGTVQTDHFRHAVITSIQKAINIIEEEKALDKSLLKTGIDKRRQNTDHRHMLGMFQFLKKTSSPDSRKASMAITATQELSKMLGMGINDLRLNYVIRETWLAASNKFCRKRHSQCRPSLYRMADGSCNNLDLSDWGMANRGQKRYLPPEYSDDISKPRQFSVTGKLLPSPRTISNKIHRTGVSGLLEPIHSAMLMQWGQLLDHDILDTPTMKGHDNADMTCCGLDANVLVKRSGCFSIEIPSNDPYFSKPCMNFVRSAPATSDTCDFSRQEQLNQATSYIDASYLYGTDVESMAKMRSFDRGFLRMNKNGLLMPSENKDQCATVSPQDYCMKSGDRRIHVVPGLASTQVVMLREHNRIAGILGGLNPHWNDERIFQETRKIVAAFNQHITYTEYLPKSPLHMTRYGLRTTRRGYHTVYNPTVDASIANVFGVAAFRFGHSQIPPNVGLLFKTGTRQTVKLEETFNKPSLVIQDDGNGVDNVNRALMNDQSGQSDRFLETGVIDKLFLDKNGDSFDLASLNIQRGRDHGVAGYNAWRKWCGLPPAFHFRHAPGGLIDMNSEAAETMSMVYSHPDDIDLYAGGLSEIHVAGGEVGPTFACIIARQFKDLKFGDRFWYENKLGATAFTRRQLKEIKRMRLSKILCNNMEDSVIANDALQIPSLSNPQVPCRLLPDVDYKYWREIIPTMLKRFPAPPRTVLTPFKYW